MGLKNWTRGFLAAIFFLLLICIKANAADTSAADGVVDRPEQTYYTLVNPERYTLIHEVRLVNYDSDPAADISVSVALMEIAPLYSNRLREQLMPWPDNITTDEYGRRVAQYHFDELAAGQELLLTQKYVLECGGISYPQLSAAGKAGYDEQLASQYLLPSPGIESDHEEIIAFAKQAADKARDTYTMAKDAFAAVSFYMTYMDEDLNSPNGGALRALRRGQGVCEDYSKLYVAVLRALGIAARQQSGYLYLPQEHDVSPYTDKDGRLSLNSLRHAWAEFYLPGKGWVIADPTFSYSFMVNGVLTKYINWDYFAGITDERRYIFFREESLNEDKTLKFHVGSKNSPAVDGVINAYLLRGSQAAHFNDLEGHWAQEAIMRLTERDEPLLQGMGNGMFGVNEPMTRAQLVTCLQRLMKSPPAGAKFIDVAPSHWAYRDIGSAQQAGWISGYPDVTFRPNRPVTRAELAQLFVAVFELTAPEPDPGLIVEDGPPVGESTEIAEEEAPVVEATEIAREEGQDVEFADIEEDTPPLANQPKQVFLDLGQPGYAWADGPITTLFLLGVAQGNGQGYYQPERSVTRAEFATFLDRIISAREQEKSIL